MPRKNSVSHARTLLLLSWSPGVGGYNVWIANLTVSAHQVYISLANGSADAYSYIDTVKRVIELKTAHR